MIFKRISQIAAIGVAIGLAGQAQAEGAGRDGWIKSGATLTEAARGAITQGHTGNGMPLGQHPLQQILTQYGVGGVGDIYDGAPSHRASLPDINEVLAPYGVTRPSAPQPRTRHAQFDGLEIFRELGGAGLAGALGPIASGMRR